MIRKNGFSSPGRVRIATITVKVYHQDLSVMSGFTPGMRIDVDAHVEENANAAVHDLARQGTCGADVAGAVMVVARSLINLQEQMKLAKAADELKNIEVWEP